MISGWATAHDLAGLAVYHPLRVAVRDVPLGGESFSAAASASCPALLRRSPSTRLKALS